MFASHVMSCSECSRGGPSNHHFLAGRGFSGFLNDACAATGGTRQFNTDILIPADASCEGNMSTPQSSEWRTRLVENGFPDRSFDIEFWQEQGDDAIFAASWELVELAEEVKNGRKPTLQRTVTTLKQL